MMCQPRLSIKLYAKFLLAAAILLLNHALLNARPQAVLPYESELTFSTTNPIDALVLETLKAKGIEPANVCSDEVFLRRAFLDVIGTLPGPQLVLNFINNPNPNKRAMLIDMLLQRPEFADYWSLKWGDLLRVKAEFPINLWPNGVQAYHRWIHSAIKENMPYDQFARELLTSSGSNFRVPQVNFYRAIQGEEPAAIASAAALTFMGVRVEKWPVDQRSNLEAFFSRIAFKPTAEWKEVIVYLNPAPTRPMGAVFPDGSKLLINRDEDPRQVFADWLIRQENPWFARNIVNRSWCWLMGRGIIHEPDDIQPDNPAVNPKLLAHLEQELVKSSYDLKHIFRLILNSRTYQQSSIPRSEHAEAESLFAHYPVRQLDAEVLIDILCQITGTQEAYSSPIPEPFTFIPEHLRSINLADGSITSQFLEMFGRPSRDTGLLAERNNNSSDAQRLHLLNSTHIQRKIERSTRINQTVAASRRNRPQLVNTIYAIVLSRFPTEAERIAALAYYQTSGLNQRQATHDLVWALINTKEFLYRH